MHTTIPNNGIVFIQYLVEYIFHGIFSDVFYESLSNEQNLISVIENEIGCSNKGGDIFEFLESRIYDRENINVLLLLEADCLLQFVEEVK